MVAVSEHFGDIVGQLKVQLTNPRASSNGKVNNKLANHRSEVKFRKGSQAVEATADITGLLSP